MHEMSLEKQGSEGSLKCKLSEGSPNRIIYINRRSGPTDIYSSEGGPQTNNIYQFSERPN